ncbi:retrovirus-related pol polyprotein from transposon TNT 1-94 [Tanacetum coccineum]
MSNQQDIYAADSENRPLILNKENYVPWSTRLLCYAKNRPNGKVIYNFIINGPYVRRMFPELGDANHEVPVNKTFHNQTDDELTEKELKQVEADDQAIRTILLFLPKDIYGAVDSCKTAQEIWLVVQQMMKGSDIRIQEKKAKLFNEWERFTSTDGESIESYYYHFSKLMNDFKRNKHFPETIAINLKFLNNLQPEWSRHVTIIHQTKDLHTSDYTQLYDFLKYNQKEVDELRVEQLAKTHDPLPLIANSNNPFNYPVFHQEQSVSSTYMQQLQPNNNYNPQPSFNQNYMQQPMPNPEDITDPTTAMNMALVLMAKALKLNYSTPTNNNQRILSNPHNRQIAQPSMNIVHNVKNQNPNGNGNVVAARAEGNAIGNNGNQIRCYNYRGLGHLARNCTVRPRKRDAAYLQTQLLIAQKEEARIQLQDEEFDLMAAAADLDEIKEVNANCILMANLQRALRSGTQTDKAPVYDSDGLAEAQNYDNCYNNEIFNMFTQEEHIEQGGGTVDQLPETIEEIRAYFESLYINLAIEVEKVNIVNRKLRETNADLTTELARYKNQEICFDISQEKYDKLERSKFVRDFKSLAKEADESLAKHKTLELEIERLLRAVVSQDIMSIVQNPSVVDSSNLQTELDRTKERYELDSTLSKTRKATALRGLDKCLHLHPSVFCPDTHFRETEHGVWNEEKSVVSLRLLCTIKNTDIAFCALGSSARTIARALSQGMIVEDYGKLGAAKAMYDDLYWWVNHLLSPADTATRHQQNYPLKRTKILSISSQNQLRSDGDMCMYALTVSTVEPKNVKEAMTDPAWIESMQEELLQFKRLDVWVLVPLPDNIKPLTLKWLFKNKHDEENTNGSYKDIFGIMMAHKSFTVFQDGRENCFIAWHAKEDVYVVCHLKVFIDADHQACLKLKKATHYGLKQAPRAWYDELVTFLYRISSQRTKIDPTLFIRRFDDDILVVQVYVDDIIFGSTHPRFTTGRPLHQSSSSRRFNYLVRRLGMRSLSPKELEHLAKSQ